ncbi:GreA/GreB family elongation factor [Pseudomonas akapageensis]|uniref:GreA/GreB family elongation factor n=1 Tax=Pseudomonas akapageensis TaxID=2609961 RepID=UPI00140DE272|nr:GreA/GreB family elongation factor [Pseudomonas akapageensis]
MSRAFVNEEQAAALADLPVERHVSDQPNYVTAAGLAQLHARFAQLRAQHDEQVARGEQADKQRLADIDRDLRYFSQRLQSAQVVAPATSTERIQIGSWVTYADADSTEHKVQLVGEDQADTHGGLINWASPLGRALLGAGPGDEVLWKRPAGDQLIEVIAVEPE